MGEYIFSESNSIQRIADSLDLLTNKGIIFSAPKQHLHFQSEKENWVYLLKTGVVDICRLSDHLVVQTIQAPAVIGLTSLFNFECFHFIHTNTNSILTRISLKDFHRVIEEQNLWRDVCLLVCYKAQFYFKRDELVYSSKVYGVIKNHLEIIWAMPEELRRDISIFSFILSRTSISRSSLNKILKDLNKGGYISMNRGKLVDMKKLPLKY